MKLSVYTDGACRGNPGRIAGGVIIVNERRLIIRKWSGIHEGIPIGTNNQSEYLTLVKACEIIRAEYYPTQLVIYSDSKVMINQLNGTYKCNNNFLREFKDKIHNLLEGIDVVFVWVPRTHKMIQLCDLAANRILDNNEVYGL